MAACHYAITFARRWQRAVSGRAPCCSSLKGIEELVFPDMFKQGHDSGQSDLDARGVISGARSTIPATWQSRTPDNPAAQAQALRRPSNTQTTEGAGKHCRWCCWMPPLFRDSETRLLG